MSSAVMSPSGHVTCGRSVPSRLRFWYHAYSPQRSSWARYSDSDRARLLDEHASTVFEDQVRAQWPDAARYWESDVELDVPASLRHSATVPSLSAGP
jgi:hypothetical protein